MTGPQRIRERDYQRTLVETLEVFGWWVNHTFPLRTLHGWRTGTTAKGWPDLIAVRGSWLLAIEVKGEATLVDAEQIDWLERFALLRCSRAWILRPTDDWAETVEWFRRPHEAPKTFGWTPRTGV